MNVGIIGYGVVGTAIAKGLSSKGHYPLINDIKFNTTLERGGGFTNEGFEIVKLDDMAKNCEVIFICVNTPTNERGCDLSRVYEAFNSLHFEIAKATREQEDYDPPVVAIKSTVLPGTTDSLYQMYPYVCSNPEFIRELTAEDDFLKPDRIIVGAKSPKVRKIMEELYSGWGAPLHIVSPAEAELAKYMSNAFLVTKVAFSQECAAISKRVGADAYKVMSLVCGDHRINESHMNPEPGKIPQGSACLPKDLMALIKQLEASQDSPILLQAIYVMGVAGSALLPTFKIVEESK